ncbi:hypothetical protein [Paraflavitalea pollutisoli]|uniref:hypothetical protein n=1 Tax=Paraflavitalea pollutisoli TaxID=3034143 RepID=UPI0023EDB7ED|nr:hypothetical protein [Paraflavitalea sp. H1-2-19X]
MQFQQNKASTKVLLGLLVSVLLLQMDVRAQVNTVEFGKNRVQYRKFKWQYYQSTNFNTYFYENGQTIANYVLQIAEEELPAIEQFVEYGLQRRANIVIYNNFNELEQSNIGLNLDWQTTGGITKLVNNKMIVYFNGDHSDLRRQIRQGIARILVDNILFGDDLGEFAANQALLDLPKWLVDGYVDYVAEDWSTTLDEQLKSAMLAGTYKNFYQFAFEKPLLAGHAFWYYIADKYKKENVTYFLYLARVYRNLNSASQRITKKKFKDVLRDFMEQVPEKYYKDITGRRNAPKGNVILTEDVKPNRDFIRFTPNPAPRSMTYAVVEYVKGQNQVVLYENFVERRVLLKNGIRSVDNQVNPAYPLLFWDGKGTRLGCIYWEAGKVKLFVYDVVKRYKPIKMEITHFEQIQSASFMLNSNTILMSAVRKGQPDIFIYKIEEDTYEQVTNDGYADLDASFVAFPNKTGIIFSSNRPDATTIGKDTGVATTKFNIFLTDTYNKSDFRQITQLSKMKYGNARFPVQYNTSHFTFISDETGIANRFAGFFTTRRAGLDSVYIVGDEILRNPSDGELDSTLKVWGKPAPDSVFAFSVTKDSAYVFPITNYQSGLVETKAAGDNGQVSEVRQEGDLKLVYRLKVDQAALQRRNVNPKPTEYRRKTITSAKLAGGQDMQTIIPGDTNQPARKKNDAFETGFETEKPDSVSANKPATVVDPFQEVEPEKVSVLQKAKLFPYRLKFSMDNFTGGFNNDVLITKYQPYTGSLPVQLQSGGAFNGMLKASVFDLFEDIRFTGAIRLPLIGGGGSSSIVGVGTGGTNLFIPASSSLFDGGGEWFARVDYLKKRMDYSLVYYRKTEIGAVGFENGNVVTGYEGKSYSNLYQAVIKYPFDKVRSLRLSTGVRLDRVTVRGVDTFSLKQTDVNKQTWAVNRLEYVHDNVIEKAMNIWNGLRYKAYMDVNALLNKPTHAQVKPGRMMFNLGFDGRMYVPIYRNFIWAGRLAADFSWGNEKIVYYLGGVDGWMFPKYNQFPTVDPSQDYSYQSLAVNMRGFRQNLTNGNNSLVFNSEFRFPVFSTLINRPINNAFIRNFQVIQFIDLGNAWDGDLFSGGLNKFERPQQIYVPSDPNGPIPDPTAVVRLKAGGIGPLAGGYGFGVRSTLLGYFLRLDAGWEMNGIFRGKPILHFAMGVDF